MKQSTEDLDLQEILKRLKHFKDNKVWVTKKSEWKLKRFGKE